MGEPLVQPDAGDQSAENIGYQMQETRPVSQSGDPCLYPFCGYQPHCIQCRPPANLSAGDHSAENIGSDICAPPLCGYQPHCIQCHPHANLSEEYSGDILIIASEPCTVLVTVIFVHQLSGVDQISFC